MAIHRPHRVSLCAALLTMGIVLVACAPPPIPEGMTAACTNGELRFANEITPERPVDFLGILRESTEPGGYSSSGSPQVNWSARMTDDVRGTPCSGATDKAACQSKVSALRTLRSCGAYEVAPKAAPEAVQRIGPATGQCTATNLVYTRGDEVGMVASAVDARAFFGEIDTPKEAIYLARLRGERFGCDERLPAAFAQVPEGFDVQAVGGACTQRLLRVTRQGVVSVLSTDTDQRGCREENP
ncbi:MAG: hypothetical protein IPF92_20905 [Myxococcales bacterium]|nr:hypothetical protein [Myxococcales bacterium]